jgi:hypothetical protein
VTKASGTPRNGGHGGIRFPPTTEAEYPEWFAAHRRFTAERWTPPPGEMWTQLKAITLWVLQQASAQAANNGGTPSPELAPTKLLEAESK